MAEQHPGGDALPTIATVVISVISTVAGWRAWKPLGNWLARRIEADRQARAVERGEMIAQLSAELRSVRDENVGLRQELGEERELRMTFAQDYALLKRDVEHLTKAMAEDKRDCQREIRRLNGEVRRLNGEIADLRAQRQGGPP